MASAKRLLGLRRGGVTLSLLFFTFCSSTGNQETARELYRVDLEALVRDQPELASLATDTPLGEPAVMLRPSTGPLIEIAGTAGGVPWVEARYLVADVYNPNGFSAIAQFQFYGKNDPEKPRISSKFGVLPDLPTRVVIPLEYLDGQTFFMARQERRLKGVMPGRRLAPEEIDRVEFKVGPVAEGFQPRLWVAGVRLLSERPEALPAASPIVDAIGQWKADEWPGKTSGPEEMKQGMESLHQQSLIHAFPADWSSYGGWKGKKFDATGFFRTQHDGERWWLVDPEGYAFFSVGVDVVIPRSAGPVDGMEDLLDWLPSKTGEFAAAFSESRSRSEFSFLTANLIRVFGDDWESRWQEMTRGLLVQWGFNTVANWSDLDMARSSKLPYVIPLRSFPTTETLIYRDFPDVYAPEYAAAAAEFAKQAETFRQDPYLIGYFLDNEPEWVFGGSNLVEEMLSTEQPSRTRQEFVRWLAERYENDVRKLSEAWDYEFESFAWLENHWLPGAVELSARARSDQQEFSGLMVDRLIQLPSEALKKTDPNHLNLGIRYASISSEVCYRAGNQFDVFSINAYRMKPEADVIEEITHRTGKPVIIGEFHHGAIDRGLPSTGIRGVASQEERGVAYRYYVEQGAALPSLVGIHFFQWNDQPILGRFDGENYNIGLVDICNRPHRELTDAATETNRQIYDVVSGKTKPFGREPKKIPDIYF